MRVLFHVAALAEFRGERRHVEMSSRTRAAASSRASSSAPSPAPQAG